MRRQYCFQIKGYLSHKILMLRKIREGSFEEKAVWLSLEIFLRDQLFNHHRIAFIRQEIDL